MSTKIVKKREHAPKEALEKRRFSPAARKEFFQSIAFLTPSVLGVTMFFIAPFAIVVFYSLVSSPVDPEFVGLKNFIDVLQNSAFQTAAKNTAVFSLLAVPLAVVLSLLLALLLEQKIPGKSMFRTFFLSPMMVPVASVVLIWQVIFHETGTLNQVTAIFGADPVDWLRSPLCQLVIVVLFLWKNLGYNMILFMAALSNIPRELLEVADVEGASAAHKFFHIKLRYLSPTVLFVTILSIINSFKVFREVYLMSGAYPYDGLYTLQHFMNNTFKSLNYQKLSAAAVMLAIVMVIIIALMFRVEDAFGKDVEG